MKIPYFLLIQAFVLSTSCASDAVWRWECIKGYCQKFRITPETKESAISLPACRLFCSNNAGLWPKPNGNFYMKNLLVHIDSNDITMHSKRSNSPVQELVSTAFTSFKNNVVSLVPLDGRSVGGRPLQVQININNRDERQLKLNTNESYSISILTTEYSVNTKINSTTYFGARHALETLGQLIIYDDIRGQLQVPGEIYIEDKPLYPYRGILLDTSRNYISVPVIKRIIDGMSLSKLNTFHWHITDSHSFPYVSKSNPNLSRLGAYSPSKVYTPEDVNEIIQFGLERGVRILPEFDAPAHVGEGWQDTDFVTCFNQKPWQNYCVEPPCGQFDPTKSGLYDALEGIYKDMVEQFKPDVFHMGGDEVSLSCWNSTENIVSWMKKKGWGRSEADFMKLWNMFQSQALERLQKHSEKIPVIMWTSTLTKPEYIEKYLPKDDYIIQVWTTGYDRQIQELLDKGYKLILSNYDALYFDCGFAGWVQDGNNWCSPYIGWQKVYENSPAKIGGSKKDLILGAEATLWTEQVDDTSVDSRLWPRAAAMAERLWSDPSTSWRDAESRFLVHRERLVKRGISADAVEPEWCLQNEENCPINGHFNW